MSAAGPKGLLARVQHHFGALGWTVLGHGVKMAVAALGPEVAGLVGAAEGARRRLMKGGLLSVQGKGGEGEGGEAK